MTRETALAFVALTAFSQVGCRAAASIWEDGIVARPEPIHHATQDASTVGADELTATAAASLRDALNRTRPAFLRSSPAATPVSSQAAPSIYIDGRYAGPPDVLFLVQVTQVREVRYLRASPARIEFGSSCPCAGGAIVVATWAR